MKMLLKNMNYLALIVLIFITSCKCEQDLECNSISTFVDSNYLLDSISLVVPNALIDVETSYNFVHLSSIGNSNSVTIESYELEISMEDVLLFSTSNSVFIIDGAQVTIPKDLVFQNANYTEGYAGYRLKLVLEDKDGFINIEGELLLTTCASLVSSAIDISDCRYSYDLIPPLFGDVNLLPCH